MDITRTSPEWLTFSQLSHIQRLGRAILREGGIIEALSTLITLQPSTSTKHIKAMI